MFVQIFVQSFVISQNIKDNHWLKQNSKETDIDIDELLQDELIDNDHRNNKNIGESIVDTAVNQQKKKELQMLRKQLNELLNVPLQNIEKYNQQSKKRIRTISRGGINTNNAVDKKTWKKRSSFFVYTPSNT